MIAVDTNVLVYAHRRDSGFHEPAAEAVRQLAESPAQWAVPWPCLHEFYSIVTHPRIYDPPTNPAEAADQIAAWLESPSVVPLSEGDTYWVALKLAPEQRESQRAARPRRQDRGTVPQPGDTGSCGARTGISAASLA